MKLKIFIAVAAMFLVGGVANAQTAKVKVCHFTNSSSNPEVVITVSDSALQTHLDHGDIALPEGETSCVDPGPDPV